MKKWIFEDISMNWQWHKFIFIGGSSMPWWNWEVIQRKRRKLIQRLVKKNRQTSVYDDRTRATNQVRQADQWQKLYRDNLFWQNGQHSVELVWDAKYLWPYTGPTPQQHTPSGDKLRIDNLSKIFSFLRTTICTVLCRTKLRVLVALSQILEISLCSCHMSMAPSETEVEAASENAQVKSNANQDGIMWRCT